MTDTPSDNVDKTTIPQNTEVTNTADNQTPELDKEQINWKKFREEREKDRKARIESERIAKEKEAEARALKEAMEAILSKPTPVSKQSEDYEESEEDKIAKKVEKILQEREQREAQKRREEEQRSLPIKLKQAYGDFDQVCTEENLDYLQYHYPGVAQAFAHMPEGFEKWSSVYQSVKKLLPSVNIKKDAQIADANSKKPISMSVSGKTSTADQAPNYLTDERRKQNWERMRRIGGF